MIPAIDKILIWARIKKGIYHHSKKEDSKIGQIAKFGREVL